VAPALCFVNGEAHNAHVAKVWVGTSGFSYKEWKGLFYPENLPDKQMLPFYATRFAAVEIDSTFYRMPSAKTLESWRDSTPAGFRFVLKAPQHITHRQRLQVPSEALNYLMSLMPLLGDRLGLVSYQLPPFFNCDPARLQAFLEILSPNIPAGFEFRHPSWFTGEVYELLRLHRAILCVHDTEEGCSPLELTAGAVYVRLRRDRYSDHEREEWRARLRDWANSGIEVFAFIKHKDNPDAPRIAQAFAEGF
jgi:uncharacterized protein YecE (DUF72 family)